MEIFPLLKKVKKTSPLITTLLHDDQINNLSFDENDQEFKNFLRTIDVETFLNNADSNEIDLNDSGSNKSDSKDAECLSDSITIVSVNDEMDWFSDSEVIQDDVMDIDDLPPFSMDLIEIEVCFEDNDHSNETLSLMDVVNNDNEEKLYYIDDQYNLHEVIDVVQQNDESIYYFDEQNNLFEMTNFVEDDSIYMDPEYSITDKNAIKNTDTENEAEIDTIGSDSFDSVLLHNKSLAHFDPYSSLTPQYKYDHNLCSNIGSSLKSTTGNSRICKYRLLQVYDRLVIHKNAAIFATKVPNENNIS